MKRLAVKKLAVILLAGIGVAGLAITAAYARQIWAGGFGGRTPPRLATANTFQGGFNFCRAMFRSDHREKQGWGTDYPGADINFSIRLAELTKVNVTMTGTGEEREPEAIVVQLTDEALFQCPFLFMQDAGTARFSDAEVTGLQNYLLKGGFLLIADYHGDYGRQQFDDEIGRALPRSRYPIVDLTPPNDHPMWRTMFPVAKLPQMASIATWRRSGGTEIIERWNEDGAPPTVRGIADEKGRLMVVMVHNTDLPDPWEREGEDQDYFFRFSPEAYAVGIDIMLYAMTH